MKKTWIKISSSDFKFNKSGKYFKIDKLLFAVGELINQAVNFPRFDIFLISKDYNCFNLSHIENWRQTRNLGISSAILQATKE